MSVTNRAGPDHQTTGTYTPDEVANRDRRLYAWTVNERGKIDWLRALGVHGIATADPRLFA